MGQRSAKRLLLFFNSEDKEENPSLISLMVSVDVKHHERKRKEEETVTKKWLTP